jgi:RHS repeat-associated protein
MGRKQRRAVSEALAGIPEGDQRLILATGSYIGEGFDDARLDTLFLAMPISWKPATFTFTTATGSEASSNSTLSQRTAATNEPDDLPSLQGLPGVTSLSGRVLLSANAKPLPGVSLELDCGWNKNTAQSDVTGRFLITSIPSGHCLLEIDGTKTGQKNKTYGLFFAGVDIQSAQTNVLPYNIWLTEIDTNHAVNIPSPTQSEIVVATPLLPGLELHLPSGTVISDYDGNVITQLSITPIPVARPPFPLPNVPVPFYFTIQPGGAFVHVNGNAPQGARLIYPNGAHAPAGARFDFWNYEPAQKGWYVYGHGSVSTDGRSIVPDPGVVLYEFTGAMATSPTGGAPNGPNPGCDDSLMGCKGGEPVDLGTGLFVLEKTDLYLAGVAPIRLTRMYRPGDSMSRAFGIGASHNYNIFLAGPSYPNAYTYLDLILADGRRIHYVRTSSGTSYTNAIFVHTGTQTKYYESQITWNGNGWNLLFKDGSLWVFPDGFQLSPTQSAIISMADRDGNMLTMNRNLTTGNLNSITSSSGRWISFNYDAAGRIIQAQDNSGRTVSYTYDAPSIAGRLIKVVDANGGVTQYTYDSNNELTTITDPRNITYLTNHYDSSGRVIEQDLADGGVFHFSYTTNANGNIIQTTVTNPRGFVSQSNFDTSGYLSGGDLTSFVAALGRPEQQTTTYQYDPAGTGLMLSSTDPLGRQSSFTYDSCGNMNGITWLAGTANAVNTAMTYQTGSGTYPCVTSTFNLVTSITDPLSHTTSFGYDAAGKNLISVTDPLQHAVTISSNTNGQPASITDFAGTTQFTYTNGDLVAVMDPTNDTTHRSLDTAGRLAVLQAPLGQITQYQYDALNDLLKITDPLNGQTAITYDGNENLLTVQDALSHTTTYTANNMDRVASRTDALLNTETSQYDLNGNLSVFTDRKSQVTSYTYDGLDRLTQITFQDQSSTTATYDAGNRITQIVDSISGTIARGFDGLDRLTSETTPQGSVSYTYDNAGRRTSMTVAGQPIVNYTYDNANRLTQISQGTATVTIGYDNANRRTSVTLPNGIAATYGYDAASRMTSITYTQGSNTVANLTYAYDANGRRTSAGGSLAQVNLPSAVSSATYNANNQLTQWGSSSMTYDLNGNLTNDGTTTYTWDARNQLGGFGSTTFAYDAGGRRTQNAAGTNFLYDGGNPVQELSGTSVAANLLTGLGVDEIFTRTDSGGARDFLTDALGSTVALTDSSGTVQTQYAYEPFGKTTSTGQTSTNSFEYTGRENDATGLYFDRARYYNPALGRFISEDPIGFGGGDANLYAYTSNAPTNFVDPSGMQEATVIGCAIGGPFGCAGGGAVDLVMIGGALIIGGATVINFDPNNPPQAWPDPANPPGVPHPSGKPDTWLDPDGDTWHWHDDPTGAHGPTHWDLGFGKGSPLYPEPWWWPKGGKPGPTPSGKNRGPYLPGFPGGGGLGGRKDQ